MKVNYSALAAMLGCALVTQSALAQTLRHPTSVRPVSLSNDSYYSYYYSDEEEASPSDVAVEPKAAEPAPVAAVEDDAAPSYNTCTTCNPCYVSTCRRPSCGGGGGGCFLFGTGEEFKLMQNDFYGFTAGGWTQVGYHSNETRLSTTPNDALAFNDHGGRANLHQQWLWLERALSGDPDTWDWGFRMDFMYGTDAAKTQSFGGNGFDNSPNWDRGGGYGFAMPQLYGEIGRGDLSVQFGHFYTYVGYEVVPAPMNFFYSHALAMFNSEPFTQTGELAKYNLTEDLQLLGGWTLGWDTGFERVNDGSNWLGGFIYSVSDELKVTYVSTAGNFGAIGRDGYEQTLLFDLSLTDKLNYVLETDYKHVKETQDDDIGITNYLIYSLNDCWGFGGRMEWWKDDGNSHYELTGGVNYRPHANLVLRPEVRHDWNPGDYDGETVFGMDAILTY
jgi:hypothetical protein